MLPLLLLGGCTVGRYTRLPDPAPTPYARAPLDKVMFEMDERRNNVESLVARLNILLRDNELKKEKALTGAYLGDKNGNLRLRVKYQETLLLDFAVHDQIVDLWLPRKGAFYRGTRKDAAASGNELALLIQAGNAHDLFFPRAWTDQAVQRRWWRDGDIEYVSVLEQPGLWRRKARQLAISPEQPVAQEMVVFDRQGKPLGTVAYGDYRFPGPRAGAQDGGSPDVPYPGRLTLTPPDKKRSLRMEVEELILNSPLRPRHFEIELPEDQKIQDLGTALSRGKNLWE